LNDFSAGETKIGEKQPRQSNSKYIFMQYVFFEKKHTQCTMGSVAYSWSVLSRGVYVNKLGVKDSTARCVPRSYPLRYQSHADN